MKLADIMEASYPGNIGVMEMVKFYQIASDDQKAKMKELLANKKTMEAWKFLQRVVKVKLH
jgi:hypothetical protein